MTWANIRDPDFCICIDDNCKGYLFKLFVNRTTVKIGVTKTCKYLYMASWLSKIEWHNYSNSIFVNRCIGKVLDINRPRSNKKLVWIYDLVTWGEESAPDEIAKWLSSSTDSQSLTVLASLLLVRCILRASASETSLASAFES